MLIKMELSLKEKSGTTITMDTIHTMTNTVDLSMKIMMDSTTMLIKMDLDLTLKDLEDLDLMDPVIMIWMEIIMIMMETWMELTVNTVKWNPKNG